MDEQPRLEKSPSQPSPTTLQSTNAADGEYKPNIYQLIFWALTYGVIAGLVLLVLRLLANYLALLWGPVFLAALVWGGYRNYLKQKQEWHQARGEQAPQLSTIDQIREAARDIVSASQEVAEQQQEEDRALADRAAQEAVQAQQSPEAKPIATDITPETNAPLPPVPTQPTPPPKPPVI